MHNRVLREAALALKVVFLSRSVEEDAKNAEAGIKIGRIASFAFAKGRTTFTLARLVSDSVNGRLLFLLFAVLILGIRTAPYDIPQPNPEIDGTAVGTATNARAGENDSSIDVSITPVSFSSVSAPPFGSSLLDTGISIRAPTPSTPGLSLTSPDTLLYLYPTLLARIRRSRPEYWRCRL